MKYSVVLVAVMAMVITTISATGAIAQNRSKEQRKQVADTGKKASVPTPAPVHRKDTAKKIGVKH